MSIHIRAVGIDLGHGNVKIAYPAANGTRTMVFPAIAPVLATGVAREMNDAKADGVQVNLGRLAYFVGPGADNFLEATDPGFAQDHYSHTPQYRALMLGSIAIVAKACGAKEGDEVQILCLGLGLPLTTFWAERAELAKAWKGAFDVPMGSGYARVHVHETTVIAQPVGALLHYADTVTAGKLDADAENFLKRLNRMHTLVLDAGGGTLDYLVTMGGVRTNSQRSGANVNAMDKCARAVANKFAGNKLENWLSNPFILRDIRAAISSKEPIEVAEGEPIPVEDYLPVVDATIDRGLSEAYNKIGDMSDIKLVLAVGGGGRYYAERFKVRFPQKAQAVQVLGDPLFTNVLGFHARANLLADSLERSLRLVAVEAA